MRSATAVWSDGRIHGVSQVDEEPPPSQVRPARPGGAFTLAPSTSQPDSFTRPYYFAGFGLVASLRPGFLLGFGLVVLMGLIGLIGEFGEDVLIGAASAGEGEEEIGREVGR